MQNTVVKTNALLSFQSLMATLLNIRCHTCQFNPQYRDQTMAEILSPCTASLCWSENEDHGLKIQCNIPNLCLNVTTRSIQIILDSWNELMASMEHNRAAEDLTASSISENEKDYSKLWEPE